MANFRKIGADGTVGASEVQDFWFRYDSRDRLVVDRGVLSGDAGAALAAAPGSVASQTIGLATGIQDKFSFKGVALAALGGAVGGGLGQSGLFGGAKSSAIQAGLRGAAESVINQGIASVTGLQSKFDFAGVAAAGIGGGAGNAVARGLASPKGLLGIRAGVGIFGSNLSSNTAGAIANAATRSAIQGTSFGDNVMRALPDVIGSTVGNLVAGEISLRAEARASGKSFVENAAELKGLNSGAAEYASFIEQNRETVRSLSYDVMKIQRSWARASSTWGRGWKGK